MAAATVTPTIMTPPIILSSLLCSTSTATTSSSSSMMMSSPSKIAVHIMNITCGLCADPIHYHSFTNACSGWVVPTPRDIYISTFYKCIACHGRLGYEPPPPFLDDGGEEQKLSSSTIQSQTQVKASSSSSSSATTTTTTTTTTTSFANNNNRMLQCIACGMYAHRTCALLFASSRRIPQCKINLQEIQQQYQQQHQQQQHQQQQQQVDHLPGGVQKIIIEQSTNEESTTKTLQPTQPLTSPASQDIQNSNNSNNENVKINTNPSLSLSSSSWSVLFHLRKASFNKNNNNNANKTNAFPVTHNDNNHEDESGNPYRNDIMTLEKKGNIPTIVQKDEDNDDDDNNDDEDLKSSPSLSEKVIETSIQLLHKTITPSTTHGTTTTTSTIGMMMVGGVAGFALAGPAGIIVGTQVGRRVSTVVESGLSMATLALNLVPAANHVGIGRKKNKTATTTTFEKTATTTKERELVLLENSTLVLVRPDIEVDPVWGIYAKEARKVWQRNRNTKQSTTVIASSSSSTSGMVSWGKYLFTPSSSSQTTTTTTSWNKEEENTTTYIARYAKDSDIVQANELQTKEKVFLLVNRILNDKTSLPGYVYRSLIMKHKRRTIFGIDDDEEDEDNHNNNTTNTPLSRTSEWSVRSCRQDAHGIIKHVTATLLEVRPGLAYSPTMTEFTASAVEALIFGELYNDCFHEIMVEKSEMDECLVTKVQNLRAKCHYYNGRNADNMLLDHPSSQPHDSLGGDNNDDDNDAAAAAAVSVPTTTSLLAIAALQSLPQAHTPADKLFICVEFLEYVSAQYSSSFYSHKKEEGGGGSSSSSSSNTKQCIDADTLLTMVCRHVVMANIPNLYAEIAFIEEFSRDEQLLSGKEGYALITLQASLQYLNSFEELPMDILSFS